ncbi:MAG: hypothetical protein NT136_04290 [Candidatus Moranbacteria bacterium]|nr:hypothetical protein [Candidatus Moranbacteria bacterium]
MDFQEIQKGVINNAKKYQEKYKVNFDETAALIKLFEEVGELSEAYLTYAKKSRPDKFVSEEDAKNKVAKEIADVVGVAIMLASLLDIDLEKSIDKKWINKEI